ncbi:MAG: CvpA family protein [Planctomycetota bacterium]
MHLPHGLPPLVDLVGILLVTLLFVLGAVRGLWWQVIRLVGVTLSVVVARAFAARLAERVLVFFPELSQRSANGIGWGILFVLSLFCFALLGLLGQRMLEAMKLGVANRLGGACAGVLTGLCLHVAVVVLMVQLATPHWLGRHVAGSYSEHIYTRLGLQRPVVMAAEAAHEVDQVYERRAPQKPRPESAPKSDAQPQHGVVR